MKILIIDDDQNIRKLVSFNLSLKKHQVFAAKDGQEGIQLAISQQPDLILLDIMMPVMNGYETCKKLKADERTKNIPVFMLSARGQMTDLDDAFNSGADDYIVKPFDVGKLNYTIDYKMNTYLERLSRKKTD
ncbi:MAG: response regulator [Candidatus Cloacimonetes bacterium]|nr:response regulator [Candidatus Cloacimonadota bacterium]